MVIFIIVISVLFWYWVHKIVNYKDKENSEDDEI